MSKKQVVRIFLVHEKKEYLLNQDVFSDTTYIEDLIAQYPNQNPIRINLPKWVTAAVLEIFNYYMSHKTIAVWKEGSVTYPETTLQRVLWLADFLQIEDFEEKCILSLIIPQIDSNNCLLFLNESFKKLKACEESNDIWYNLLNHCLNFTSKNLTSVYRANPNLSTKINAKILEEIIERSLKLQRAEAGTANRKEFVNLLMNLRNSKDVLELLSQTKKMISTKTINSASHPNINWKLSNITSMINKETKEFKFHGLNWKLRAKVDASESNGLMIYLKNVSTNTSKSGHIDTENDENLIELEVENCATSDKNYEQTGSKSMVKDIITIYYRMDYGKKQGTNEIMFKNINMNLNEEVLIAKLSLNEWSAYKNKELGFTIYLNLELSHSMILLYLAENLKELFISSDLSSIKREDLISIIKYTPPRSEEQEILLLFTIKWAAQNQSEEKVWLELFSLIEWGCVSLLTVATMYGYRVVRNKEGMCSFLEKVLRDQLEKTQGKYFELCDLIEKPSVILNNLDLMIKRINVPTIPIEIEITNLKEFVKKIGSGPQKKNLPAPSRTINNLEINKTVYGEIKTRNSLFPENQPIKRERDHSEKREVTLPKEEKRETTLPKDEKRETTLPKDEKRAALSNLPSCEDFNESNLPSNKLNKLKEKQKIFKDFTFKNESLNDGANFKPPITPMMQEHPHIKEITKKPSFVSSSSNSTSFSNPQKLAASRINLYNYDTKKEFNDAGDGMIDYSQLEEERIRIFERIEKEKEQRRALIMGQLNIKNYIGADSKWLLKEIA